MRSRSEQENRDVLLGDQAIRLINSFRLIASLDSDPAFMLGAIATASL
jgi:hypothetical protein